ncbi:MBL fold metallo-hydrolase [Pseudocolwellia sp. HL-MZ7]|uniref:MBL fold metallo-hydrolase n=1 Tax=Pseudocolwellia sp. HL-MZ7 TaxID=3400627 RepID=UPI003CE7645A
MKIEFYGVRGSMPTPGENTVVYGGNTSCVYLELSNGNNVILDSGTGIAKLNGKFKSYKRPIHLLVTHNHWDHIQGFPYFAPIYSENTTIEIITGITDSNDTDMILKQMSGTNHPVKYDQLPSKITLNTELAHQKEFSLNTFKVTTQALNHPDGGTAYCLTGDNQKVAYVTDNELKPPYAESSTWDEWVAFIKDADVLIHDAQYNNKDMPLKHGWGHSTYEQVAELAMQANVKQVFLISHDPSATDSELARHEKEQQQKSSHKLNITWAKEGCSYLIDTQAFSTITAIRAQ